MTGRPDEAAVSDTERADDRASRAPRAAPESGRSTATARGRADPPGDPVRELLPEAGGDVRPGKSRWRALIHWLDQRMGTEREGQARAVLRAVVAGPPLERFLEMVVAYRLRQFPPTVQWVKYIRIADPAVRDRIGEFPAAVINCEARGALGPVLGAKSRPTRLVRLSAENAVKQVINHPELVAAHYRMLPDLMEHGKVIASVDGRHITVFREFAGASYLAVVKQTAANELYLKTFHKVGARDVPRLLRRSREAVVPSITPQLSATRWRTVGPPVRP